MIKFKQILIILIFLLINFPIFSQDKPIKAKQLLFGLGSSQYMNSYSLPSGLPGINYSIQFNAERSKSIDQKKLSIFSLRTDYSQLQRKNTNTLLDYPTDFYFISLRNEFLYKVPFSIKELQTHIGFNIGFTGYLIFNNNIYKHSAYFLPPYGTWNFNVGFSQTFQYKLNKFTLKNRWDIPVLLLGFFLDYQNIYKEFLYSHLFTNIKFVNIIQYADFHNYFSIDYPIWQKGKFQRILSFTYAFSSHWSEVNYNLERFRKHTFLIGIVFKKK